MGVCTDWKTTWWNYNDVREFAALRIDCTNDEAGLLEAWASKIGYSAGWGGPLAARSSLNHANQCKINSLHNTTSENVLKGK